MKKLLCMILALIMVLSLCACGQEKPNNDNNQNAQGNVNDSQRFWEVDFGKFSNVILVNIDRVMASILYAFAVASVTMGRFVTDTIFPDWLSDVIILTLPVVFFLVDLFVISKKRIGHTSVS